MNKKGKEPQGDKIKYEEEDFLNTKGVVYGIKCRLCDTEQKREKGNKIPMMYIGEIGRKIRERITEHFTNYRDKNKRSEIFEHGEQKHGESDRKNWDFQIIKKEGNKILRKMYESKEIANNANLLNKSKGITYIGKI